MKPILFNIKMVRAILEGRKTVTRRLIKPSQMQGIAPDRCPNHTPEEFVNEKPLLFSPYCDMTDEDMIKSIFKAPYQVGDILYIRETWREYNGKYFFKANEPKEYDDYKTNPKWKPSIHMPKEAARIFLKVTDVRVERLQDITPKQAGNEGVSWETDNSGQFRRWRFHELWDSTINKKDLDECGWNANPWVWVIEFEKLEKGGAE